MDKKIKKLPLARIELATFALQVQRSTTKLKRHLYEEQVILEEYIVYY